MLFGRSEHTSRCVCISALFSTAGASGHPNCSHLPCVASHRGEVLEHTSETGRCTPGLTWHITPAAGLSAPWSRSEPAGRKHTQAHHCTHTAALALQSCLSCVSLLAKTDTANNTGNKILCALYVSVKKGMFACKHIIKNVRCFIFILIYHLIHCKGNIQYNYYKHSI